MINRIILNYWVFFLSIVALTVFSCNNNDWILYRAGSDYFPLNRGNWWKYQKNNVTTLVEVKGDTIAYGRFGKYLLRDFADEFWTKDNGEVRKLILRTINFAGTDYILQQSWLLQYQLPFVLGNVWSEVFTDTITILGDSFFLKQTIRRKITAVEDINVPAGTFFQTYKIEFIETWTLNDSTEQFLGYEWFAPGVGLIKRIINNVEEVLIDYSVK